MRFYKLRVTPNATKIASTFNEQFKPEKIAEHNDYQTEWMDGKETDQIHFGDDVCVDLDICLVDLLTSEL
jgi:actin-related protein 8